MPVPMDIMLNVINRLIKEDMKDRTYSYEEHKEIERKFNDLYDAVLLAGERKQKKVIVHKKVASL
jgi:hypothetical protein